MSFYFKEDNRELSDFTWELKKIVCQYQSFKGYRKKNKKLKNGPLSPHKIRKKNEMKMEVSIISKQMMFSPYFI